jgi:hypothetical protein
MGTSIHFSACFVQYTLFFVRLAFGAHSNNIIDSNKRRGKAVDFTVLNSRSNLKNNEVKISLRLTCAELVNSEYMYSLLKK